MKRSLIVLTMCLLALQASAQKKPRDHSRLTIDMKAENWAYQPSKVAFSEYKSRPSMQILPEAGVVVLKDFLFSDGTIEFDMETIDPSFASVYFRWQNENESECFYLRTGRIGKPLAKDAVQYAPFVSGVNLWDIMEHYQTNATLLQQDWNHIKLVISGRQMKVYVNSPEKATLVVPMLEGNTSEGTLAFSGQCYVSNLVVKPGVVEGLTAAPGPDPTGSDPNYLRSWQVSAPVSAPKELEFSVDYFPSDDAGWSALEAERRGLVNLTRSFGKSESRRIVWLKTTLHSEKDQLRELNLGFSDEVWVLINGRLLYVDKNLYGHPIMKYPEGRCTLDNSSFQLPLKAGENELLIGVANSFYGWAVMARIDKLDDITLP